MHIVTIALNEITLYIRMLAKNKEVKNVIWN